MVDAETDTPPPSSKIMSNENVSDDSSEGYEPEYEPEQVVVSTAANLNITHQVLSVVPPPLEYMSTLHSQQQEISGRQVWTGSLLLAQTLCHFYKQQNDLFQDKRILELGSGTGILGMTVSKLGHPACVVLTDGDEKAVSLLQDNLADPFNSIDSGKVKARLLLWGYDQVAEFTDWCRKAYDGNENNNSSARVVWKEQDTVKMDCIIAGDVMYKRELPPLFFSTVDTLLASSSESSTGGTLWLCHVPRAAVTHEVVVSAARDAGFAVETVDLTTIPPVEGCPLEDLSRAKVYRITRQ